jgi:formate/nitrite transporter FocA (FNT family)
MSGIDGTADTQRHYGEILTNQVEEGLTTLRRPASGQFLSAVSCGLDLGIGPFVLLMLLTALSGTLPEPLTKVLMSIGYTFGFVFVVLGRSELFTEHTTLAVLPVLVGESSLKDLSQLWVLVYLGNIVGGFLFAGFAVVAGPSLHVIDQQAFVKTAKTFIDLSPTGVFTGALLAGWLMGLLSWILTSVRDTISRIAVIVVTTFVIGFGHLPHCVAGNIEVVAGMLAGADITVVQWARFLTITTVGNAVGGVVFVTLIKYGHVVRGYEEQDVESIEPHTGGPSNVGTNEGD